MDGCQDKIPLGCSYPHILLTSAYPKRQSRQGCGPALAIDVCNCGLVVHLHSEWIVPCWRALEGHHVGERPCARQQLQLDVVPLLVGLLWKPWAEPPCLWPRQTGEPAWRRSPGAGGQDTSASFLRLGADAGSACKCSLSGGSRARYFDCASATLSAGSKFPVLARLTRGSAVMSARVSGSVCSMTHSRVVHRVLGASEALG